MLIFLSSQLIFFLEGWNLTSTESFLLSNIVLDSLVFILNFLKSH